jgi:hypothetical protein
MRKYTVLCTIKHESYANCMLQVDKNKIRFGASHTIYPRSRSLWRIKYYVPLPLVSLKNCFFAMHTVQYVILKDYIVLYKYNFYFNRLFIVCRNLELKHLLKHFSQQHRS